MIIPQTISVKDTRDQISRLIEEVAIAKKTYIITKFGKPKAKIVPVQESDYLNKLGRKKTLEETFGIWKDRKDLKDSAKWVFDLRHKTSSRYGKIFS